MEPAKIINLIFYLLDVSNPGRKYSSLFGNFFLKLMKTEPRNDLPHDLNFFFFFAMIKSQNEPLRSRLVASLTPPIT